MWNLQFVHDIDFFFFYELKCLKAGFWCVLIKNFMVIYPALQPIYPIVSMKEE